MRQRQRWAGARGLNPGPGSAGREVDASEHLEGSSPCGLGCAWTSGGPTGGSEGESSWVSGGTTGERTGAAETSPGSAGTRAGSASWIRLVLGSGSWSPWELPGDKTLVGGVLTAGLSGAGGRPGGQPGPGLGLLRLSDEVWAGVAGAWRNCPSDPNWSLTSDFLLSSFSE